MSKRTHALVLVAMVAAMNLAGLTAIAQAQPPDTVEQFRRGERASQQDRTPTDAVERFRQSERPPSNSPPPPRRWRSSVAASAPHRSRPLRTRPSSACWPESASPSPARHPTSRPPSTARTQRATQLARRFLGGLAAALALIAGLVVLVAKRAGRRARVGHAA